MKRQWLAAGLVFLGLGMPSPPAIANSMRNANLELRTMLCAQNWNGSIRAIDQLKSLTSDRRQELDYLRAVLVNMRDQGITTVPDWPATDYCVGAVDTLPSDVVNAANTQVGDFTPPRTSGIPFENVGVQGGGNGIAPEQLHGIWYTEAICRDPASGVEMKFQLTAEYQADQQYTEKLYMDISAPLDDVGNTIDLAARMSSSGIYSLTGNSITQTVLTSDASYDRLSINGQQAPADIDQQLDQYATDVIALESVGEVSVQTVRLTADGKLDFGPTPGCETNLAYQVVSPLF